MRSRMLDFSLHRPRGVFALLFVLVLLAALQLPRIHIDTDPENMLPAGQPERVFHNDVKTAFALHDAIVVGLVNESHPDGIYNPASLAALEQVTARVLEIEGVLRPDLMSLAVADNIDQAGPGTVRFERLMPAAPATREESLALEAKVGRLPLALDTLAAGDGRAAAIYVPIRDKSESYRIAGEIRAIAAEVSAGLDAPGEWHLTGLPVAEDTFGHEMFVQMAVSAPLAALVIFALMWWFFRSVRLVLAPMIVAMATVIVTMGLLIGLGFTVHIMSSMIPIFLMPIAVVDSVHIMSEFADRYVPGADVKDTVRAVVRHLFRPMLFTSLTSFVGFASLALTPIPPVQVFGLFVGFGILLAFVLTITFIPAWAGRMQPESLARMQDLLHRGEGDSPLARWLRATGAASLARSRLLLSAFALLFATSLWGIAHIEVNDNPTRWFKADHRIRVADEVLNRHFAGTYDAWLALEAGAERDAAVLPARAADVLSAAPPAVREFWEGVAPVEDEPSAEELDRLASALDDRLFAAPADEAESLEALLAEVEDFASGTRRFQEPVVLEWMGRFQAAIGESGLVGKSNALPDLVKTVYRELKGGAAEDFVIPDTVPGVAQALLQFQSSHRPQDLWHMVTPDYRRAVVWLQLASGDNQDMSAVKRWADEWLAANPPPVGIEARWAGKTWINVVWQQEMVHGMVKSLAGAFVVVFVMMALLFRSALYGVLAMLPLTITIAFIYGVIGWTGKDYDMPIAVLSALTLGLSVDFAIHFLERAREAMARTGDFSRAMAEMFEEPARAIARNAIVIAVGFTPLLVAPLVPYVTVGVFLAGIMAVSAVVTLVLLPATMRPLADRMFRTPASTVEVTSP